MARRHFLLLPALAQVLAATTAFAAEDDSVFRVINIDSPTGLEVGRGFDILSGKPRGDCVDRSVVQTHPDFGPTSVSFRSVRIENSGQLDQALGITASASLSVGSAGGSASASFSKALSVSSYSLNYLVETVVTAKGDSIRDVKLKDPYKKLIEKGDDRSIERFRAICGDGYISEFAVGGSFQALIQIHTSSKADSEALAVSANASFSMASGSASFSNALKKYAKTNEVHIWSVERGGGGPVPVSPDELTTRASGFPDLVKGSPTPRQIGVFSYIVLLEDPLIPLVDFSKRETAISLLSDISDRARDQQSDAQYILDHPQEFYSTPTDLPKLAAEINSLEDLQIVIRAKADACIKSAGSCDIVNAQLPLPGARPARK